MFFPCLDMRIVPPPLLRGSPRPRWGRSSLHSSCRGVRWVIDYAMDAEIRTKIDFYSSSPVTPVPFDISPVTPIEMTWGDSNRTSCQKRMIHGREGLLFVS